MLKNAILILDRINTLLVNSFAYIAGIMVILLMLVITSDVALRYLTGKTITWAFESSEYVLLYITFLGTTWLLRHDNHVKLDVIATKLSPRKAIYLNIFASFLLVITCALLLWYGAGTTIDAFESSSNYIKYYTLPKGMFLIIIPIASVLLLIESIKRTYSYIRQLLEIGHPEQEIEKPAKV